MQIKLSRPVRWGLIATIIPITYFMLFLIAPFVSPGKSGEPRNTSYAVGFIEGPIVSIPYYMTGVFILDRMILISCLPFFNFNFSSPHVEVVAIAPSPEPKNFWCTNTRLILINFLSVIFSYFIVGAIAGLLYNKKHKNTLPPARTLPPTA